MIMGVAIQIVMPEGSEGMIGDNGRWEHHVPLRMAPIFVPGSWSKRLLKNQPDTERAISQHLAGPSIQPPWTKKTDASAAKPLNY